MSHNFLYFSLEKLIFLFSLTLTSSSCTSDKPQQQQQTWIENELKFTKNHVIFPRKKWQKLFRRINKKDVFVMIIPIKLTSRICWLDKNIFWQFPCLENVLGAHAVAHSHGENWRKCIKSCILKAFRSSQKHFPKQMLPVFMQGMAQCSRRRLKGYT